MNTLKTLSKSVREYKKPSFLSPLFISIEVLMECFIPLVISKFINAINVNNLSGSELMKTILIYGGIVVVMAFISLMGGAMAAKFSARASAGFASNLRKDMFYSVQNFSFTNIDKFSSSSLVTRLTSDVSNVQMAYQMIIRVAIRSPLMLIFSLSLAFTYHQTLPLVFLAVAPILVGGLVLIMRKAHPIFKRVFKKYDALNSSVQENIKGMRVVKSYVREDFETKKFEKATVNIQKDFTKAEKIVAFNNPLMMFSMYACMLVLSFFGAKIIVSSAGSAMEIGDLTALITYSVQILSSLMMLSMIFLMLTLSAESARRIVEVIKEKPTIVNPENPVEIVKDGSIEFKNVKLKYSEKAETFALSDIDLKIKPGQTIGIIGGTGSAKSSLVQLIPRLYDATEGEVLVGGVNVKDYDIKTLRDSVAMVLQKNLLFSGTIAENLRWGNENATQEELEEACKLAQADEFIQSFPKKYETHIEQGGSNVSGGQKQRLCIARALLKKPKILILDDSTSAVDTKTDALLRKAMASYIPETTKIIIAQRIASVQEADQIIVMDNGKINGIGSHNQLLKSNKIYQEVYYSQNKVGE